MVLRLSNSSLRVAAGILTGCAACSPKMLGKEPHQHYDTSCHAECTAVCEAAGGRSGAVSALNASGAAVPVPFAVLGGGRVVVHPQLVAGGGSGARTISVNADSARCFLYSSESGLPAPPVSVTVPSDSHKAE